MEVLRKNCIHVLKVQEKIKFKKGYSEAWRLEIYVK
jgi:hypothetical protein